VKEGVHTREGVRKCWGTHLKRNVAIVEVIDIVRVPNGKAAGSVCASAAVDVYV